MWSVFGKKKQTPSTQQNSFGKKQTPVHISTDFISLDDMRQWTPPQQNQIQSTPQRNQKPPSTPRNQKQKSVDVIKQLTTKAMKDAKSKAKNSSTKFRSASQSPPQEQSPSPSPYTPRKPRMNLPLKKKIATI